MKIATWMTTSHFQHAEIARDCGFEHVVLDNLKAHKVDGARQAIAAAGAALLYLPPYSPDLNPIEQAFAKLKALLRKAAARTRDARWATIGRLLDACPAAECSNYLRHCGYGST